MSTAIIYSGQARTFRRVWENHHWHVWRKFDDPHFFVSVADDAQAVDMVLIRKKYASEKVFIERVEQPQILEPTVNTIGISGYPPSAQPQAILRQLWALDRAYRFFEASCARPAGPGVEKFTQVVRIRCDTHFMRLEVPPYGAVTHAAYTPWWSRWGGVNDRFAILGADAAKSYFRTYQKLETMLAAGAPLHPESLIHESLRLGETQLHPLPCEFYTDRLGAPPVVCDPTVIDIADYARSRPGYYTKTPPL